MIQKFKDWLNANPTIKMALSTGEGAAFGVIASYLTGIVNGTGTFNGNGLKRTLVAALSTGAVAAYNLWKKSTSTT